MKFFKNTICLIILFSLSFLIFNSAFAGPLDTGTVDIEGPTDNMREAAGFEDSSENSLPVYLANIIKVFLSLLGIIFTILIIYGGYTWMTAGGNEDKVSKAKQTIQRSIIGFIIILLAYAITYFVFKSIASGGGTGMAW